MDVQSLLALLVVLLAVAYVARRMWRTLRSARARDAATACGSGCGCAPTAAPARRNGIAD
jgi:hypothetical protein